MLGYLRLPPPWTEKKGRRNAQVQSRTEGQAGRGTRIHLLTSAVATGPPPPAKGAGETTQTANEWEKPKR